MYSIRLQVKNVAAIYHVVPLVDACESVPSPYAVDHFAANDVAAHSSASVASYAPVGLEL